MTLFLTRLWLGLTGTMTQTAVCGWVPEERAVRPMLTCVQRLIGRRFDSQPAADVYFPVGVAVGAAPCVHAAMRGSEAKQNRISLFLWLLLCSLRRLLTSLLLHSAAGCIPLESDLEYRANTQNILGSKLLSWLPRVWILLLSSSHRSRDAAIGESAPRV